MLIYTNDSDINDKIDATAMTLSMSRRVYLNKKKHYTMYSAELYDIILALTIAMTSEQIEKKVVICVNNQVVIKVIANSETKLEQQFVAYVI